jgi:hypothetical protein
MPKVLVRNYSTYTDVRNGVQFNPVLIRKADDPNAQCFVGVADVNAKTAKTYADRPAFEVISDEEYTELTTAPAPADEDDDEPAVSPTGDPLADAAKGKTAPPPPTP